MLEGSLEVWDIAHNTGRKTRLRAKDDGISWFPDGRRLACVTLAPRARAGNLPLEPDGYGAEYTRWDRIPCVTIYDTETGESRVLHAGQDPLVSADGRSILALDREGHARRIDVASGDSIPVRLPGQRWSYEGSLLAYRDGMALYWALPTEGTDVRYTKYNSPMVGPKEMLTIKIADLETGAFQTVVPYIDPRDRTTYGPAPAP